MQNLKSAVNLELEKQLKESLLECRQFKQENIKLNQLYAELKQQYCSLLKSQESQSELESNFKLSLQENKILRKELAIYQDFARDKQEQHLEKPTYLQIEQELNDLQEFFRKYYSLQENLLNQIPIQLLKECWQAINQTFKSHFNTHQNIQNLQDEVTLLDQDYKELLHSSKDSDYEKQLIVKCNANDKRRIINI